MIKVIVVDDEKIIRNSIINKISWNDNLICCAEAIDGVEALELSLNLRPDIIITDIRMPQMNGIDFIAKLKEVLPDIQTIFVSSYNDFKYVKSALEFESCAYILKPIKKQELNDAVAKAVTNIEKTSLLRISSQFQLKLLDKFLESFYSLIDVPANDFKAILTNLYFHTNYFHVLLIRFIENFSETGYIEQIISILLSGLLPECTSRIVSVSKTNYVVLITSSCKENLISCCRSLIKQLSIKHSLDCSIVLGNPCNSVDNVAQMFANAKKELNLLHLYAIHEIILPDHNTQETNSDIKLPDSITQKIIDSIYMSNIDELNIAVHQLNAFISSTPALTLYNIKHIFSHLLSDILRTQYERHCPKSIIDQGIYLLYNFSTCTLQKDVSDQFFEYCSLIITSFHKVTSIEDIMQQAGAYMKEHFQEDITLNKLSHLYHLNLSYFSTSFKVFMGKNFNEYLTEIRMENAKKLLNDQKIKIRDIASLSGYSDTGYFSKAFRKYTGMLPNEYRKQLPGLKENV